MSHHPIELEPRSVPGNSPVRRGRARAGSGTVGLRIWGGLLAWAWVSIAVSADPPITPSAIPVVGANAPKNPGRDSSAPVPGPGPGSAESDAAAGHHAGPEEEEVPGETVSTDAHSEAGGGDGHGVAAHVGSGVTNRVAGPGARPAGPSHGKEPSKTAVSGPGHGAGTTGRPAGAERVREKLLDGEPPAGDGTERSGFESRLEVARRMRRNGNSEAAVRDLVGLLKSSAPNDVKRPALLELAAISEDSGQMGRAQQIMAQYTRLFSQHPSVVEVYLRQGLLYREMGATELALAKFHSVFSSALSQRFDQLDYYRRMVLQAQTEIADTYYLNGRWEEAREYFQRVMRLDAPRLTKMLIHYKLLRVLAEMGQSEQTAAVAGQFVDLYSDASQLPEVRFLMATALKKLGRNEESLAQVLKLLETGKSVADERPEQWLYWQKRAGNDIANQLYREGDYVGTLEIYRRLADLDPSAGWQLPVWYQIGLAYEKLEQTAKATDMYDRIVARETEAGKDGGAANLAVVIEMAKWRRGNLGWTQSATAQAATFRPLLPVQATATATATAGGSE